MKCCPGSIPHAVHRPFLKMNRSFRVPVPGSDNHIKPVHDPVDHWDYFIAIFHSQRTAGTKIVLYVYYKKCFFHCLSFLSIAITRNHGLSSITISERGPITEKNH